MRLTGALEGAESRRFFPPYSLPILLVQGGLLALWQVSQVLSGPWHFPLDDAYIHLAYARTLALTGVWGFNPGVPSTGATSLLWPVLEAPGWWLGRPEAWGWIVSALWLLILGHFLWRLVRALLPERRPRAQLLAWSLVALQAHWFLIGLSGMESVALVACGVGVFVFLGEGRWIPAGCLAGAAALLRPEGVLVGAVATAWVAAESLGLAPSGLPRGKAWVRALGWVAIPTVLAFGIFCLVNLAVGGGALPTTYGGRSHLVFAEFPGVKGHILLRARFPLAWVHYVLYYAFGGRTLDLIGSPTVVILGWVLAVGGLLLGGFYLLLSDLWRKRATLGGRMIAPFLVWTLAHNGAYLVLLPQRGNAGRYQVMNFIWVGLALAWLVLRLSQGEEPARKSPVRNLAGFALVLLAVAVNWVPLWSVQHFCARRIEEVYTATSRYLQSPDCPKGPVAVFDIGYLGCFSGRTLVDLGGLLHNDPEIWTDPRAYAIRKGAKLRVYQGNDFDSSPASPDLHGDRVLHEALYTGPFGAVLQQAMAGATNGMVVLQIETGGKTERVTPQ